MFLSFIQCLGCKGGGNPGLTLQLELGEVFISENHGNLMMRTAGRKLSANVHGSFPDLSCRPSFANEYAETGVPMDNDDKLYLFGLLMSEIRGSHMRCPTLISHGARIQ